MVRKPVNNLKAQLDLAFANGVFEAKCEPEVSVTSNSGEPSTNCPVGTHPPTETSITTTRDSNNKIIDEAPQNMTEDSDSMSVFNLDSENSSDEIFSLSQSPIQISRPPPDKRIPIPAQSEQSLTNEQPLWETDKVGNNNARFDGPNHDSETRNIPRNPVHYTNTKLNCALLEPALDINSSPKTKSPRIIESSPAVRQLPGLGDARFRLSQAPESNALDLPRPEIGSLFTEKIALLEQIIQRLKSKVEEQGLNVHTEDLDRKITEVDRRIDDFNNDSDEIEDDIVELYSSPLSQRDSGRLPSKPVPSHNFDTSIDSLNLDEDVFKPKSLPLDANFDDSSELEEVSFSTREPSRDDSELSAPQLADSDDLEDPFDVPSGGATRSPYFQDLSSLTNASSPQRAVATSEAPLARSVQYPWTRDVMQTLKAKFGLHNFRSNQAEAINETLAGRDVAVLMPTGGGKSLCYQLPALITSGRTQGTTIVISPLISLMEDQVYHLKNRSIRAEALSSKMSSAERFDVMSRFLKGELQLLYASPEMLSASGVMQTALKNLYKQNKLARIVIDEAHCVSSWGHDFRPDYLELSKLKDKYPTTPLMALTATANDRVLLDIVHCLRPQPLVLKQSFNRRNLFYEVWPKTASVSKDIIGICRQYRGRTGIVYCNSKRNCEDLSSQLVSAGISAKFYHAGMEQDRRSQVQSDWQQGKVQVVCATIAFGMGIDKPDVRFVIHMTLPRNIEGFYQETGRAGRDGKQSRCILFYTYADVSMLQRMIMTDSNLSFQHKEHHRVLLTRVMQYCENTTDCRRKQVLQYFNETFDAKNCHMQCDNCRTMRNQEVYSQNMTKEALMVVATLKSISKNLVTTQQCIDVMLGRKTQKVRSCKLDELPNYGQLNKLGATCVERLVHTLISESVLEEYSQYNHSRYPQTYLKIGKAHYELEQGKRQIMLKMTSTTSGDKKRPSSKTSFRTSKRRTR